MINISVGDRITHSSEGEGTVLRKVGTKLIDVLFDEDNGVGKFIELASKNIETINGKPINRRLAAWRPTNYVAASNRYFSEPQLEFLKNHVTRIVYRAHPYNWDKFKIDYEITTGQVVPFSETNRHPSAYADCAEIYFNSYPPVGLFEFKVKQQGDLWFTENVGLAWVLFKVGFRLGVCGDSLTVEQPS